MAATDTLSPGSVDRGLSKGSALPAQRVIVLEDMSRTPARSTRDPVMTRFDTRGANRAGRGVDERQRGVVERTEKVNCGRQNLTSAT